MSNDPGESPMEDPKTANDQENEQRQPPIQPRFFKCVIRDQSQQTLFEIPIKDPKGGPARHVVITSGNQTRLFEFTPKDVDAFDNMGRGQAPEDPIIREYNEVTPVMRIDIADEKPKKFPLRPILRPGERFNGW